MFNDTKTLGGTVASVTTYVILSLISPTLTPWDKSIRGACPSQEAHEEG